jgi:hypothetical protein
VVVLGRKDGLAALRPRDFALVMVDESSARVQRGWNGFAAQVRRFGDSARNQLCHSGCGRLVREVRAALIRRERELDLALRAAATSIQSDLRDTAAGLRLQSQLAMAEPHFAAAVGEVKTGG